ncbi:hypothetical protein [Paucisalibacillus globulus]|uniref:hypothetical protein n=1 Tax=Paucisalibacillus globulus TaxID=351095 RepID=UPI000BB93C17|nr:hypothetical protein [Paucisalibacillus globulus]
MSQEELESYRERLNEIKQGSSVLKVGRLEVLMKDLVGTYNIPSYPSIVFGDYRKVNPEVTDLYLEVVGELFNMRGWMG